MRHRRIDKLSLSAALLSAAISILATACHKEPPLEARSELVSTLLAVSESVRIALEPSIPKADDVTARLEALVEEARARVRKDDKEAAAKLAELVFETHGYEREVDDADTAHTLLPYVIENKKGSCTGLSGLYLVLAEQVGLRASGILVPGHFFVRVSQKGRTHNVELLRQGEAMPDEWYEKRWPHPKGADYMRPLNPKETAAVFMYNAANAFREKGRLERAQTMYQSVIEVLPAYAEPRANLGAVYERKGDIEAACRSYGRALSINPSLPRAGELKAWMQGHCLDDR